MFNNTHGGANMAQTIYRLPEVKQRTGLQRSTIYKLMSDGLFPRSVSLGARAVGWLEAEIEEWITERVRLSRGEQA
jgi:prophage regulatory protein